MSEVERYAADLNKDWALRADAEKYDSSANRNKTPLERTVAFAALRGYRFTIEEAKEYALKKGEEIGVPVTENDLELVGAFPHAGGILGILTGDF